MGFELESDDDYAQRRLERLEVRYRRAKYVLAGAQAQYHALRKTTDATEGQLIQSVNRVRRAREQLEDILSTIEFLEDQNYHGPSVRPASRPGASST
jgi:septal ring factor EnvC (AmiA/AmiB activator)